MRENWTEQREGLQPLQEQISGLESPSLERTLTSSHPTDTRAWQIRKVFYTVKVISVPNSNLYRNYISMEILGKNISQSTVLENSFVVHQAVAGPSTTYFAKRFTWSHPCLCALCCITAVTQWKISYSWVQSICGTETDARQVLGATNIDSKAYNVPFEAEL